MHCFSVIYFVFQRSTTCVDTRSLPSPIFPSLQEKGFLLSECIARLLLEEREEIWGLVAGGLKQLIELGVTTSSQPKTYLKPCSLCLQTLLVGAAPHKLGLTLLSSYPFLSRLRHKLSFPVQGRKELYWSHALFSHPLACRSFLEHRSIFPCRCIFDNT